MKWSCRIALAATALLLLAALGPVQAQSKRVLLLHSFGQDFKPWSEYARSIRSELQRQSPWQLDITDHSLVTARSRNEDPWTALSGDSSTTITLRHLDAL